MSSATRWSITPPPTAATPIGRDARMTLGSTSSAWSALARAIDGERRESNSPQSFARRPVRGVLVDAGPLVALLDQSDFQHAASVAARRPLRDPLVTVWRASTHAMYLLALPWRGPQARWRRVE